MNLRKLIMLTVAAGGVLALALALLADRPVRRNSAPDKTPQSDTFEEIDAHIERQMERLNVPGATLAIVEDDKIVHLRGFGQARPGGEEPTPHTLHHRLANQVLHRFGGDAARRRRQGRVGCSG